MASHLHSASPGRRHARRHFLQLGGTAMAGAWLSPRLRAFAPLQAVKRPRPTPAQLAWQRDELALFVHFGVNTFMDREWGDGKENPGIFYPADFDARQWAMEARKAGFKAMVLTAKHHDGFCLWPSRTTTHSIVRTAWRGGGGDVVRMFVDACRSEGLRPGLYLSPWDRNNRDYGLGRRYNDLYADQLTELLTNYGPLAEVWFDGANGEGPNGKKQVYDWPRTFDLVRKLQPNAVVFSDAGPDVRWCGNERGEAGDPNWSTVDPLIVPFPGATGPGIIDALQHGDPNGPVFRPAEADVSIRPGWFWHEAEDDKVKSPDELVELYFSSVGRNSKLLLNVPPTKAGQLHATDVKHLHAMHARLSALFADDRAKGKPVSWAPALGGGVAEVDLGEPARTGLIRIEENVELGQAVARYRIEGREETGWRVLAEGTTIGYARIDRFEPATITGVRVVVDESVSPPEPLAIKVYAEGAG